MTSVSLLYVEVDEINNLDVPAGSAAIPMQDTLIQTCNSLAPFANQVVYDIVNGR
jgi:hypothetical protein